MSFTIRARLTLLYSLVLCLSFFTFFWICDFGFRRSIETTVNDASGGDLEIVLRVVVNSTPRGIDHTRKELSELAELWANGAIFQVADSSGRWLFRSPHFLNPDLPLPAVPGEKVAFFTRNLDHLQYRIAQQKVDVAGQAFTIYAAVPTEPFDQALDHFRIIEKEFLPLLALLASFLGYWLSGRALAPVNRIIESAENIGVRNLQRRLEVPRAKDELRRLTETLNAMLDRIESSVSRVTQFTADASHDLRTPLALIRTNAELALRRARTEAEYRETLIRILGSTEETTQLIEHLLTLARADAGAAHMNYESVPLSAILERSCRQAYTLASSKGQQFAESLNTANTFIHADRTAIERLILMLVDNAVKYTPPGGRVLLGAHCEQDHAVIEVADTGLGISECDLPRIFDRFYRADQARSGETRGSGLGLSIASWIAEMHQSEITVESKLGEGSVFRVKIPLEHQSGRPAHAIEDAGVLLTRVV